MQQQAALAVGNVLADCDRISARRLLAATSRVYVIYRRSGARRAAAFLPASTEVVRELGVDLFQMCAQIASMAETAVGFNHKSTGLGPIGPGRHV